jgi:hypothetical protein
MATVLLVKYEVADRNRIGDLSRRFWNPRWRIKDHVERPKKEITVPGCQKAAKEITYTIPSTKDISYLQEENCKKKDSGLRELVVRKSRRLR